MNVRLFSEGYLARATHDPFPTLTSPAHVGSSSSLREYSCSSRSKLPGVGYSETGATKRIVVSPPSSLRPRQRANSPSWRSVSNAETLRKNKTQLAKVITTEMGKIFPEAEAEVEKCAWEADWYAEHGPQMLADAPAPTGGVNAYVSYLPLGPILAIMPWNFPIWQLTRMALPTMLAGNVVLVKHSTPREAAEGNDFIIAMVSNDEASRHVWLDESNGALLGAKAGAIAIESSTLTPCVGP